MAGRLLYHGVMEFPGGAAVWQARWEAEGSPGSHPQRCRGPSEQVLNSIAVTAFVLRSPRMNRIALLATVALASMSFTVGCATKNHVAKESQPTINKVNDLDDLTAKTTQEIKDVDARAQKGIEGVNTKTAEADQKAQAAGKTADEANTLATTASNRVTSLTNQVVNLDNYRPVV